MRFATPLVLAIAACGPKPAPTQPPEDPTIPAPRLPDEAAPIPGSEDYASAEDLPPQPEGDHLVALAGDAAPIDGVVLDKDGKPWADVEVLFYPSCGEAMYGITNDKGEFGARDFPKCLTRIMARKDGARHEVEFLPGDTPTTLELKPVCKKGSHEPCPDRARQP